MEVPGTLRWINDNWVNDAYANRRFSASLPAGSYTVEFIDEFDNRVWPTYAEENWQKEPDCPGSASPGDVTLLEPSVGSCDDLVRGQGEASLSTSDPWIHTQGHSRTIVLAPGQGVDGTDAIATVNRGRYWTGLGQDVDSRCMNQDGGQYYEFSAKIKVTDHGGNPAGNINPDVSFVC